MRLRFAVLVLVLGLLGGAASADQKDPRLDALFAALKNAPGIGDVLPIEEEIWSVWLEAGRPDVDRQMELGVAATARADYDGAIAAFDAVVRAAPDFAEGWNRRATAYYLIGDFDASVADIQRTLALEPRHFGALSGLGLIYLALGQDEGALKAFLKALEIHPYLPGAKAQIQEIHRRLGGREI